MSDMILIFLNLWRLVLWPSMLSVLENVSYAIEKDMDLAAFGCNVLYISINLIWSNVSLKGCIDFLSGCSVFGCKWMLKIVLLSIFAFMSVNFPFMYLGTPMLVAYIFTVVISSWILII